MGGPVSHRRTVRGAMCNSLALQRGDMPVDWSSQRGGLRVS
jgi:hypothetical protein